MDIDVDTELAPLSLAAARALFRAPQAEDACWADVHMPDGTVRACGRPEATNLGLCAEHRMELFGLGPADQGSAALARDRSTCSESLRTAIRTGSQTGENGGA